jgi:iron complex transport system ATP-binding protein
VARPGELPAVVGPNGAGKSTLLRTLVGAQNPLRGEVTVGGRPLGSLSPPARARHLAVVLTDRVEPGRLTVGDVVLLGRHPHTGWTGRATVGDVDVARAAADRVGAGHLWTRPFAELSDGQRQRVLVARALAQEPALIVLDEPTAFLDLPGRAALTAMLGRLVREAGVAAIVSTHDLDLALGHADVLWVVDRGSVVTGAPEDLLADGTLSRAFAAEGMDLDPTTGLLRARPPHRALVRLEGGTPLTRALVVRTVTRCGVQVADPTDVGGTAGHAPWTLVADDTGWRLACGRHEHRGTTFAELATVLRAHAPTPPTGPQEDR